MQLLACPPEKRPSLALFLTEQLPTPHIPEWFSYGTAVMRSRLNGRPTSRVLRYGLN
ncbi:MAG: hypothetical protein HC804_05940, partial [Anaerolineae bacterium]|nr:hypothetical protein [Anaerolineae bacterium]